MIRQAAFEEKRKMLKGELHCHTKRSDGAATPEEAMRFFADNGYDFAALTDHRLYNYENFLPESNVLVIPGMEYDNTFSENGRWRCFHTVCIGPERECGNGYLQDESFPSGSAGSPEEYQAYLDRIHKKKNLTVICHPEWSQTPARLTEKLKGSFAIEVWNTCCVMSYNCDKDAYSWDELLGQGLRLFGVAVDDAHGKASFGGGWVMVNAEKTVSSILDALERGAFYSTTGPEIYDFYVEDGKAYIKCSPVSAITLRCDGHLERTLRSPEGELREASFVLENWTGKPDYVRITVYDKNGKPAWTNPIWLD